MFHLLVVSEGVAQQVAGAMGIGRLGGSSPSSARPDSVYASGLAQPPEACHDRFLS